MAQSKSASDETFQDFEGEIFGIGQQVEEVAKARGDVNDSLDDDVILIEDHLYHNFESCEQDDGGVSACVGTPDDVDEPQTKRRRLASRGARPPFRGTTPPMPQSFTEDDMKILILPPLQSYKVYSRPTVTKIAASTSAYDRMRFVAEFMLTPLLIHRKRIWEKRYWVYS
jgi:hypothetical protein